jgi:hypothetical protein
MKSFKTIVSLLALAVLGGCAVYPVGPGYYGPPRAAYYQPAPYYGPSVGVGIYGHERWGR